MLAKFKFTANNKNSIDIIIIKIFLRFNTIPSNPIKKNILVNLINNLYL
jgi:hypothetical protein